VDGTDCEGLVPVGIVAHRLQQLKLDAAGFKSQVTQVLFYLSASFSEKISSDILIVDTHL